MNEGEEKKDFAVLDLELRPCVCISSAGNL